MMWARRSWHAQIMIRLGTVVLGAQDVDRAVAFWAAAMGWEAIAFPASANQFTILRDPGGEGTRLAVQHSDTPPQEQPRVHLDFIVDDPVEQATEIERLVNLGAKRVRWDYPADADFVVLADTEGNRFCIIDASHG